MSEAVTDFAVPMPKLRLTVRIPKAYGLRLWLAGRIIRFAAWVAGSDFDVRSAD